MKDDSPDPMTVILLPRQGDQKPPRAVARTFATATEAEAVLRWLEAGGISATRTTPTVLKGWQKKWDEEHK